MTHDWFSHLEEGRNAPGLMAVGCASRDGRQLGCRPDDRIDRPTSPQTRHARRASPPAARTAPRPRLQDTENTVTAWWDASQIYGYDESSRRRVKREPAIRPSC